MALRLSDKTILRIQPLILMRDRAPAKPGSAVKKARVIGKWISSQALFITARNINGLQYVVST